MVMKTSREENSSSGNGKKRVKGVIPLLIAHIKRKKRGGGIHS